MDIEFNHLGDVFDGTADEVTSFMEEKGYDYHGKVGIDAIFVKRGTKLAKRLKKQREKKKTEENVKKAKQEL